MGKLLIAVAISITAASLAAARGTREDGTRPASATPEIAKTTLTLLISNNTNLTGIKAVSDFVAQRYGIVTDYDLFPSGSDNMVKTRLATGDMDDLLNYNSGSLFQALDPQRNFVDLTDEPFMARILDSFKRCVSYRGKIYGIPNGPAILSAWLYNRKVYAALGLKVPRTWSELMANCELIKASGKTAVIGAYKDAWIAQNIILEDYYNLEAQVPGFAVDYTANRAGFATTPAALRGFEKLAEVYNRGLLNRDFLATGLQDGLRMLAEGTGAHFPLFTIYLSYIAQSFPDKVNDIGAFPQPSDSPAVSGDTVWMPDALYVNAQGKNIAAARKWIETYVSQEGTDRFISVVKPTGPFVIRGITLPRDGYPAVEDLLPYFEQGRTAAALEFISPVKGPDLPQIALECGSGVRTPLESAREYDQDVQKQAKQLGLPGW